MSKAIRLKEYIFAKVKSKLFWLFSFFTNLITSHFKQLDFEFFSVYVRDGTSLDVPLHTFWTWLGLVIYWNHQNLKWLLILTCQFLWIINGSYLRAWRALLFAHVRRERRLRALVFCERSFQPSLQGHPESLRRI